MICPNCGANASGAFCTNCGASLNAAPSAPAGGGYFTPAPSGFSTPPRDAFGAPSAPAAPAPVVNPAPAYTPPEPAYTAPEPAYNPAPAAPAYNPAPSAPVYAPAPPAAPAYTAPEPYTIPMGGYTAPVGAPMFNRSMPTGDTSGYRTLRRMGTSPTYLIAIIAYTLHVLLGLVIVLSDEFRYVRYFGGDAFEYLIYYFLLTGSLLITGMWITFGSCAGRSESRVGSGGLTLIKVVTIIKLVLFCIIMGIVVVASFIAAVTASNLSRSLLGDLIHDRDLLRDLSGIIIVYLLIIVSILVLGIIFFAGVLKTLTTAKRTAATGVRSDLVSGFSAVFCFLFAMALFYPAVLMFEEDQIMIAFWFILHSTALICFGVLIFQYQAAMRRSDAYSA